MKEIEYCICSVCKKKEYIGDKRSTDGENVQQGFISEVSLSDD